MLFTVLDDALDLVKSKIEYEDSENNFGLISDLEIVLTLSAGKTEDLLTTVYRPYYVAAYSLATSVNYRYISESKGTKFADLENVIRALLGLQLAYDLSNNLVIPDGFTVQELLNGLLGDTYLMSARTI